MRREWQERCAENAIFPRAETKNESLWSLSNGDYLATAIRTILSMICLHLIVDGRDELCEWGFLAGRLIPFIWGT